MGASFTNYQVRGKSADEVSEAVRKLVKSRAYVSPEKNGWITVYDEASDSQDDKIITGIAASLSKTLNTSVLAFLVHDSDITVYWLYQNGTLMDEFNSAPDYFEEASETDKLRVRGDANELLPLCVAGTTQEQIEEVIHPSDGFPTFAEDILVDLAKLIGIDDVWMGLGFEYFESEGEEIVPEVSEFKPIGKEAAPKKKRLRKPVSPPSPALLDVFPVAITMLTKCWSGEHEKAAQAFSQMLKATQALTGRSSTKDELVDELRAGFDRSTRDFLKRTSEPGNPTFEELKAARDQGPDALAKLLVARVPAKLGGIADGAIQSGLKVFISALLAKGMDPNVPNQHGQSLLEVAERCKQLEIYSLLKSAIDMKG